MQRGGVPPRVTAEELGAPGVGAQQSEQDPQRGRLPCPVRTQEPVDLALGDPKVEPVERPGSARTS
jgi:hypothetical protein